MIAMFPFASVFARDVYIETLTDYNPYAVLLSGKISKRTLEQINHFLRNIKYPIIRIEVSDNFYKCCKYFNEEIILEISNIMKTKTNMNMNTKSIDSKYYSTSELSELSKDTKSYCPRCTNEYIIPHKTCPSCGCDSMNIPTHTEVFSG